MASKRPVAVYAVVRLDRFLDPGAPVEEMLTIKEVLPSLSEAEEEVRRLAGLAQDDGVLYFVCFTRWFPKGRGDSAAS